MKFVFSIDEVFELTTDPQKFWDRVTAAMLSHPAPPKESETAPKEPEAAPKEPKPLVDWSREDAVKAATAACATIHQTHGLPVLREIMEKHGVNRIQSATDDQLKALVPDLEAAK